MKNLKIAIVANSCWNIYNFRMELIRFWQLDGHEVIVISPVDEYILYLKSLPFTRHIALYQLEARGMSIKKDLLLTRELFSIYKIEKPDVVFHFTIKPNIYGSIAARLLGIHSISTLTGLGYAFINNRYKYVLHKLYKFALSQNIAVVFHNIEDRDYFVNYNLIDSQKAEIIQGSGVDTEKYFPRPNKTNKDKLIFLFVGRLLKDKGINEYIQAAIAARSLIGHAEFWIIGEFNDANKNSISKLELVNCVESRVVNYFGNVKNVTRFIADADVVVLPSYREGLPRAILEAMSMEKPVIATNVAGCRELIKPYWNGLLVPSANAKALLRAMVEIYHMSESERRSWGRNGRVLVQQNYDVQIIVEKYNRLLQNNLEKLCKRQKIERESSYESYQK